MNVVSRTKRFWLPVALAAFGGLAGGEARAAIGWSPAGEVCTAERTVSGVVTERKTCVRWRPITQVCMRRQDCVTYRDECRVGYRQEQYVECVPKTCYDQITVDEGCWKMVWVPKPVTKIVPRQTVEQRLAVRNVPYTYTEKVPQLVSRWVPEYKTSYVPETYQTVERRPFCQQLPTQTTAMMPVGCAAPAPGCAMPVEPGCALPAEPGCALPVEPGCAIPGMGMPGLGNTPTFAPAAPLPNYAPPNGAYDPGVQFGPPTSGGTVPDPTPDPMSYYPTQPTQPTTSTAPAVSPSTRAAGSATWSTVKPRQTGAGGNTGLGGGSSLASLWSR
jgi:hypothetical protein